MTPAQIQAILAPGGSVTSSYAADFVVTLENVPEGGTAWLLGSSLGLGCVLMARRPKKT